jgi:alkanesulfonate monooxygenase SsuD/methylene tetrahydromethanopterin reductase-like flavin-dependent oxidoreductase (luciferase family)
VTLFDLSDSYNEIVEQVLAAEEGGLDLVGIQNHPYQRRFLDTFLLMADLLARTERLTFFADAGASSATRRARQVLRQPRARPFRSDR